MEDLNRGNYWGWPALAQLVDNYATVLTDSRLPQFVLNSFLVTIPAVVGTVVFASMAGFALAKHEFKRQPAAADGVHWRQPGAVPGR